MKPLIQNILYLTTLFVRILPLWKKSRSVEVLPRLSSLPVALPVNFNALPKSFASHFVIKKSIPPRRIFLLKNVYISGDAVVFKNGRIFIPSLTWLRDLNLYRHGKFLLRQWFGTVIRVPRSSTAALVYDQWSADNYYHWMIEALPRLMLTQQKFPDALLIVPEPAPEFIHATVALLAPGRTLFLKRQGPVLHVPNLVLPELVYYDEEVYATGSASNMPSQKNPRQEELILTVRKKILAHFPASRNKRKIFVSRSKQRTRRLVNEQEIIPLLDKYGFEIKFFEGMRFEEQVKLLQDTAVLLGVHGGNMVNILFMPEGGKVIELMNKDYLNDAYYLLSSTIGLPYYSIPCVMADKRIDTSGDHIVVNDADLVVDVKLLEETIRMALEGS